MADFVVPPSPQPFLSTPTGKFPVNSKNLQEMMASDVKVSFEPSNAIDSALLSKLIDT